MTNESASRSGSTVSTWRGPSGERPGGTPTLVLVHGFTGSSHDFALEVDALATERRVVTVDQRGHGHSTKVGNVDGYGSSSWWRTHRLPRGRRRRSRRPSRPFHGRPGGHGRRPEPARPRALTPAHGYERLVLPAARRRDPHDGRHLHDRVRPGPGHAGDAQPGGAGRRAHRGEGPARMAGREGRHLHGHGRLCRQGARHGAADRRRRRRDLAARPTCRPSPAPRRSSSGSGITRWSTRPRSWRRSWPTAGSP